MITTVLFRFSSHKAFAIVTVVLQSLPSAVTDMWWNYLLMQTPSSMWTSPKKIYLLLITVRKRSFGKVMFLHLCQSFCSRFGGWVCLPSTCWDTPPPWADRNPPRLVHAGIHTPCPVHAERHGYCCGRYASYWNAYLFFKRLHLKCVHWFTRTW